MKPARSSWFARLTALTCGIIAATASARAETPTARWLAVPSGDILIGQGWDSAYARPAPNRCLDGLPVAITPKATTDSAERKLTTLDDLGAALDWKPEQRLSAWITEPKPSWLQLPLAGTPNATFTQSRRFTAASIWLPAAKSDSPAGAAPLDPAQVLAGDPRLSGSVADRKSALAQPAKGLAIAPFWLDVLNKDRAQFLSACGDAVVIAKLSGFQHAAVMIGPETTRLIDDSTQRDLLMAVLPYAALEADLPQLKPARAAPLLTALARLAAQQQALTMIRRPGAPFLIERSAPAGFWRRHQAIASQALASTKRTIAACQASLIKPGSSDCQPPLKDWQDTDRRLRQSMPPPLDPSDRLRGQFVAPADLTKRAYDWWLAALDAATCPKCQPPQPMAPWPSAPWLSFGDAAGACLMPIGRAAATLVDGCPDSAALVYNGPDQPITTADGSAVLMRGPDRRNPAGHNWLLRFAPPGTRAYNGLILLPVLLDIEANGHDQQRLRLTDLDACLTISTQDTARVATTAPCRESSAWRIVIRTGK